MYLGNSDGNEPFVHGIIEYNLIRDPIGYCMQIKHQNPRPNIEALPREPSTTIIRYNVFIKGDRPSPDGNRPNLLVDGFPDDGPGFQDRYQVYGNVLFHNPHESLFQATGRVSVHDNVFADRQVQESPSCPMPESRPGRRSFTTTRSSRSVAPWQSPGRPSRRLPSRPT